MRTRHALKTYRVRICSLLAAGEAHARGLRRPRRGDGSSPRGRGGQ